MTAIAIDRFLTMTKSYSSYFLKKHGVRWVGGVWCISIIMMIPNFSTISSRTRTNESHCGRSTAKTVLVYPITFLFCSVLPPIVTTVICYGRIYSVVRVVANRIRISRISSASKTSNVSGTNDIENAKTEKILAKRMIIVVTFVLVSWLPYSFFEVIIEGFEISLPLSVRLLPALIAKSFAVVNPLINVIFNRKYKKKVVDYILCRCRRNNSVQPLRLQRMMLNTPFADELDFPFPKQQNGPLRVACTGNPFPILETISEHQESNMLRVAQFPMRAQIFGKAKLHFNAKLPSPLSDEERLPAEGCDDYKLTATKKPPLIRRKGVILMKGDSESFNSLNSLPSSKKI
ncbi:opsin-VA-like [Tubulanus polymorphus]|uniref:opsin-VA-like n=1 Tax=Tubulanus polymorphus TaxID=672921 RepID=UPI003DA57EB5